MWTDIRMGNRQMGTDRTRARNCVLKYRQNRNEASTFSKTSVIKKTQKITPKFISHT